MSHCVCYCVRCISETVLSCTRLIPAMVEGLWVRRACWQNLQTEEAEGRVLPGVQADDLASPPLSPTLVTITEVALKLTSGSRVGNSAGQLSLVADRLSEGYELIGAKTHGVREGLVVERSAKDGRKAFRCTKQIDVLPDEAGIGRGIEAPIFGRDVLHALTVRDIDEVERRPSDEILQAGFGPKVFVVLQDQGVKGRVIEPGSVRHDGEDVDDHDVPPIGRRSVSCRSIDAVGGPQQIGQNLGSKRPIGKYAR